MAQWTLHCGTGGVDLAEVGVWVCDDAVEAGLAAALRTEILAAYAAGLLTQSGNALAVKVDGRRVAERRLKPGIFEADLPGAAGASLPLVERLLADEPALRAQLHAARPELRLDRLESAKVQVNTSGAFPLHFDHSPSAPRRHCTAILYLNPAGGGCLRCLPLPFAPVDIAVSDRRLVVFSSNSTLHSVQRHSGDEPRVCINLWFDGDTSTPFPCSLPAHVDPAVRRILEILRRNPGELRAFCKVWYKAEFSASLRDAYLGEAEAAVALHEEEADAVRARIAPATLRALEALPVSREELAEVEEELNLGELW